MRKTLLATAAAGLLAAGLAAVVIAAQPAGADTQICDQYGSTTIGGRYVVMNNNWGNAGNTQCINVTNSGFSISQINANRPTNGAPASYPAIYVGCHYSNCSPGTNLPMQISRISSAQTSISYSYVSGTYNASYDIWLDPTPKTNGVNATEIMIWFNRQGSIQPIGSQVGTATVAGRSWQVWSGNNGGNDVVSYVAPSPINSWSFDAKAFINDVISRGRATTSWYLTSMQAGFEPWIGGQGLAVTAFSASINGGGNNTGGPTTGGPTTGGPTGGPTGGTRGCAATYRTITTWSGGFQGEVSVRNTGSGTIAGWSTTWSGGSASVSSLWSGRVTSTSPVTVRNETYNGSLGPNASTTYGFTASGTAPSSVSCTAG